jgi:ubiquitin fusion degradation protein 1
MDFKSLRCFSKNTIGDKIILPASILEILIELEVEYPIIFEIVTNQKRTNCGVLEFTAEEGSCFLPQWIMKNLDINEGHSVYIRNVSLPQATFIKFKPVLNMCKTQLEFLELTDPRAVLEHVLRSFSCATIGDKIHFDYNFKEYIIEVIDVKPKKASCIIEADIEVEFEEPDRPKKDEAKDDKDEKNQPLNENISSTLDSKETKFKPGSTKWGITSKMAHFQGKGNKM